MERVVMGAAIVRGGRVLAARRRGADGSAGGWELPGGKVEPHESPEAAVVREVREELGCEVVVTGHLAGQEQIAPGYVLRVAIAALVNGEPVPLEHESLRWLRSTELGEVDWLPPDLPFLAELRTYLGHGGQ